MIRPSGDGRKDRLANCIPQADFKLIYGDITDPAFPYQLAAGQFDEVYLLAAQTHVMQSYLAPTVALETNALAPARILDALHKVSPTTKVYFAATSEMFGTMPEGVKADESYPLSGQSPYAAAKVAAHLLCRVYREMGLFVVSGIGFNHESVRRGPEFVTRKIGLGVRAFKETGKPVVLGNLTAKRDWHHASDTVRGMWLSLQTPTPDEFVFASGEARSVLSLASIVCARFGVDPEEAITTSPVEKRPWDVNYLCGNATKANNQLGWWPKVSWEALVEDICRETGVL
jgi:GDPmannose 4,6-dehydratase